VFALVWLPSGVINDETVIAFGSAQTVIRRLTLGIVLILVPVTVTQSLISHVRAINEVHHVSACSYVL